MDILLSANGHVDRTRRFEILHLQATVRQNEVALTFSADISPPLVLIMYSLDSAHCLR